MSNISRVFSHGKWIEIETLETPTIPTRRRKDPFVMVPLDLAAAMAKATNTQQAFVYMALLYAAWRAKGKPFAFTNVQLDQAKIGRFVKRRTLDALQAAGLIEIEQRPGRAPIITLKDCPPQT